MTKRHTPLAPLQESLNARFVDFGGWDLPLLYTSIVEETDAVRNHCGLFDVSHMGRFFVTGPEAEKNLDWIVTRDLTTLKPGRQRYSLLLQEDGGILDDLMVARLTDLEFLVVVNAGNLDSDREWIKSHLDGDARLEDRSSQTVMLALQGPDSEKILQQVLDDETVPERRFLDVWESHIEDVPCIVSRSGYTGEDGFEIVAPVLAGEALWNGFLEADAVPCGLGARDLLRLEMGYSLYGHELSREVRPHECGLEWTLSKKNLFIGKESVESSPPRYDLIGFVMEKKSIPRQGCPVEVQGKEVGVVTSGGLSNRLPNGFGMARVEKGAVEDTLEIVIRGKRMPAKKKPFPFVPDHVKR